jgi:hypothetical protein
MTGKEKNRNLHKAKSSKQDEFYTQLTDIEKELKHYKKHFKGKVGVLQLRRSASEQLLPLLLIEFKEAGTQKTHYHLLQKPTNGSV